jgi:hypothetical protein
VYAPPRSPACPCLVVELMDTSLDKLLYGDGGWGAVPSQPALLPLPTVGCRIELALFPSGAPFTLDQMLCAPPHTAVPPCSQVLHIALQVARALSYLHPTIIHRDLKVSSSSSSSSSSGSACTCSACVWLLPARPGPV